MNSRTSSKDTEIIVEREFGSEDFLTLYVDVVLNRIEEKKSAEKKKEAEASKDVEFAC